MRLNKFIAQATGLSRRAADLAVSEGRVSINGETVQMGIQVETGDLVTLDGQTIVNEKPLRTILLNKPTGYVVSRNGQGSKTVYDLLPPSLHALKPIGRLDKDSSGLLVLTNDGELANTLTHPSHQKMKLYEVKLSKPLLPLHHQMINDIGLTLVDGVSKLGLERLSDDNDEQWLVRMHEGRNRQIRRTFEALGYRVMGLHRTSFGDYRLENLALGSYRDVR
jgi:23S rRNA pseudouridine2605 synthase